MSFSLEVPVRSPVRHTLKAAATAAVAAALITAATVPALAAASARQLSAARSAPAASFHDALFGVAGASPSDVWTVGYYKAGSVDRTLIEHWNGRSWTAVASPSPGGSSDSDLESVAAVSRSGAWAVGEYDNGSTELSLIEHWNGRSWRQVPNPNPGGMHGSYLNAVAAVSSSSAWAVGAFDNGTAWQTLIEHWNGRSWKRVASPSPAGSARDNYLSGVAFSSPSNAWAVGYYVVNGTATRTLVEHWNGKAWMQQASPSPGGTAGSYLRAFGAISAANAWAAGSYLSGPRS
jgi:hypothetical protein